MPSKKKKSKGRRAFEHERGARPRLPVSPSLMKGEAEPAKAIPSTPAGAPLAKPTRTSGSGEPVAAAATLQHQYVLKELKRIGIIAGSIFLFLILLSFLLP